MGWFPLMPPKPLPTHIPESETDFETWFKDVAQLTRWLVYHTRDSRGSQEGFPDWVLWKPVRLIFAELKDDKRQPTPAQWLWLEGLQTVADVPGSPVEVYLWRPSDRPAIERVLGLGRVQ